MTLNATHILFRLLRNIERKVARAQGKGYGAATIKQEVNVIESLLLGQPKLAIDIGGNVGEYTTELRRKYPQLEAHIFEPSATNIEKLRRRFADDSLVRVVPIALGDTTGTATLFSNMPGSGLGSLTQRRLEHFNISFNTREMVDVIRFEDYWEKELHSRSPDIVKIDVEGHELTVLNGFGGALAATRVLQFEFGGCNIDTRTYFQDFWYFFNDNNFDLFRITPFGAEKLSHYREIDEFFSTTNYIAVNRS
jgi:FkbM family methyltransferase